MKALWFLLASLAAALVFGAVAAEVYGDPSDVTINAPSSVPATDPTGADVSFTVKSHLSPELDITCTPGGTGTSFTVHMAVGDNGISCSDTNGTTATATVTVTPFVPPPPPDTTPPTLTVPGDITTEATGPSGAAVSFSATATDDTDPTPQVNCSPASGSTFGLTTTTVSCTATDASDNSTTKTFTVTVHDTTPPNLSLPSNINTSATSASGAVVTYSASASDIVKGSVPASCSPASGSTFPLGSTTVNCNATDGTNTANGSFTVTVADTGGPQFSGVPSNTTVEANGPDGAKVNYVLPTAVDTVDGPSVVTCSPASGAQFPLGTTTVSCHASDAHGHTSTASFAVTVSDTTPPQLAVPGDTTVYATTPSGIPETASAFLAFRHAAIASDIVDPNPTITDSLGSFAEVGTHLVGFVARDHSGNATSKTAELTVLPMPPPGTPPLPLPPPAKLPGDVPNLQAFPGSGFVRLVWGAVPSAARYLVYRSESGSSSRHLAASPHGDLVYSGTATTYTDRGLTNGVEYRYVVTSVDAAGTESAGTAAAAVPRVNLLRTPKDGAKLKKPPKLTWARNAEAAYYNVQLFRGQTKILSSWPVRTALTLKRAWKYQGKRYRLTTGVYRWYVWPGFGARSAVDYGDLLGSKSFQITR